MNTFYRVYNLKKFSREAAEAQRKEKDLKKGGRILAGEIRGDL